MKAREKIEFLGQLADMKIIDYRNTIALASLLELLVEKGIITREEVASRAMALEQQALRGEISRPISLSKRFSANSPVRSRRNARIPPG